MGTQRWLLGTFRNNWEAFDRRLEYCNSILYLKVILFFKFSLRTHLNLQVDETKGNRKIVSFDFLLPNLGRCCAAQGRLCLQRLCQIPLVLILTSAVSQEATFQSTESTLMLVGNIQQEASAVLMQVRRVSWQWLAHWNVVH